MRFVLYDLVCGVLILWYISDKYDAIHGWNVFLGDTYVESDKDWTILWVHCYLFPVGISSLHGPYCTSASIHVISADNVISIWPISLYKSTSRNTSLYTTHLAAEQDTAIFFKMAQRVALVAGVTGIVGMNLAHRLLKESWKVYGISRRKPDYLPKEIHHLAVDLTSQSACSKALSGVKDVDVIFYTTWVMKDTEEESCVVNKHNLLIIVHTKL